jgi:transcriptional regulator with XRE-family HTH domain
MARRIVRVDPSFADRLRELRTARGYSYRDVQGVGHSYVHDLEIRRKQPSPEVARSLDKALGANGTLAALVTIDAPSSSPAAAVPVDHDDEIDAIELARRVAASDVGDETISRIEAAMDDLATRYSSTPPTEILARIRRYLTYTSTLLDASTRKTLDEHRRLIVVSSWLSLLAATLHIDLRQRPAAAARLATAASLAKAAGDDEILAWTFETRAWDALTEGRYGQAIDLARVAQGIAPRGGSALIQATAQEGRVRARLGQADETYDALNRVARLVSEMPRPDHPEHHYRYDPDKSLAYVATTLAWVGDSAAEGYAREVIEKLRGEEDAGRWPRRLASAQIDLGLALVAAGKPDEAAATAQTAILSGRIVPSNEWRALEVVTAVEQRGLPEAADLRDAFETLRRGEIPLPVAGARQLSAGGGLSATL